MIILKVAHMLMDKLCNILGLDVSGSLRIHDDIQHTHVNTLYRCMPTTAISILYCVGNLALGSSHMTMGWCVCVYCMCMCVCVRVCTLHVYVCVCTCVYTACVCVCTCVCILHVYVCVCTCVYTACVCV